MPPRQTPLKPDQVEILRTLANRKIPGSLVRTYDRERLQHLGMIESVRPTYERSISGQTPNYILTDYGRRVLAQYTDA